MEGSPQNKVKVGIFVLVGTLMVIGAIFSLGGSRNMLTPISTLHAYFDNVQGLNVGSIVSLTGVNIGNVKAIEFRPTENKLDVIMNIESRFLPRVTEGASVEIRTQGALGDKFVYILPGQVDKPPLKNDAILEVNRSTDLMAIFAEKGGEAGKIFDIIAELHKLVLSINSQNRSEKIMSNFAEASQSLKLMSEESRVLVSELRGQNTTKIKSAIEKFDRVMTKIDNGEGTLGALINDPSLHQQLKAILGGSSQTKNIKSLLRSSIEKGQ